jgi:hypothetical protein
MFSAPQSHIFSSQIPAIEIKIPNFQHPNSKTSAASDSKGAIKKKKETSTGHTEPEKEQWKNPVPRPSL